MTRYSNSRSSVIALLFSAAVALGTVPGAKQAARADDNGKNQHASLAVSRILKVTVLRPGGKVLPRVPVEIRCEPAISTAQVREGKFLRSEADAVFVESSADGRVAVELPEDVESCQFGVELPGFAPCWKYWSTEYIPLSPFTLQLAPAWSVGGIVVDTQGKPLEGARIRPVWIQFGGTEWLGNRLGQRCRTNAQGNWRYDSVPASQEEFRVQIDHPQFAPERRTLTRAEFGVDDRRPPAARIVLQPGMTVSGKVTDERGAPIAGALIRTQLWDGLREAVSGVDGAYRLHGFDPGMHVLIASAKGRETKVQSGWIVRKAKPIDFRLKPGGLVRIRVVDNEGNPCRGARVRIFPFDNLNQNVDRAGRWEWRDAPLEKLDADVTFPSGLSGSPQEQRSIVPGNQEYVFKSRPYLQVSGTVVDKATRVPVKSFRVYEYDRTDDGGYRYSESSGRYSQDGHYQIRDYGKSSFDGLRIEAEGYQPAYSRKITEEKAARVDFELTKGQNVEGVVLTAAGLPAAGAKIAMTDGVFSNFGIFNGEMAGGTRGVMVRETDASGHFLFPPQDRDFYLFILHPSGFVCFKPVPLSNHKKITLPPYSRVEGTYRVGGKPVAGAQMVLSGTVDAQPRDGSQPEIEDYSRTTTGPDGRFVFERVPAGGGSISSELNATASGCTVGYLEFPAGKVVKVDIGGRGRPVVGRLKPPRGFAMPVVWQLETLHVEPERSDDNLGNPSFRASVDRDGHFHIDDVPPGRYRIKCQSRQFSDDHEYGTSVNFSFSVPNQGSRLLHQPLDLGELQLGHY